MWRDDVVPIAVKACGFDVEGTELGLGELDAERIGPFVECGFDGQAGLGGCVRDEVDDDVVGEQGTTSPVLRDVAEHAVLNLVPLTRARRKVANGNAEPCFAGELLKAEFP